MNPELQPIHDT